MNIFQKIFLKIADKKSPTIEKKLHNKRLPKLEELVCQVRSRPEHPSEISPEEEKGDCTVNPKEDTEEDTPKEESNHRHDTEEEIVIDVLKQ